MRVLVVGSTLAPEQVRLALAAAGLARRGHAVLWEGPGAPSGPPGEAPRPVAGDPRLAHLASDVVLGGPRAVWRSAIAARLTRARAVGLALDRAAPARWGIPDRLGWASQYAFGLVAQEDATALSADPRELALERVGLWSDAPLPGEPAAEHPDTEVLERACERALARALGEVPRPAVFLDRDGTLVSEVGYLDDPEALELLPGVPGALRALQSAGYPLVVVSNQSGVARGRFTLARVHQVMARLRRMLRDQGVELDAVWFCPHLPEAGCACRKPGTALLERAADDLVLSLRHSATVGDKRLDAETGRRSGGLGLLVRTGYGRDEERALAEDPGGARADRVFDDLAAAAAWILGGGLPRPGGEAGARGPARAGPAR